MSASRDIHSISVFFPAFNDEGTIASLVTEALAILPSLTDDYEVLVVDDGSTDATPAILDALAQNLPHTKVIRHAVNKGYGAALRTGFRRASKDLVFYTDGDGQYDVHELVALHPLLTNTVDVVNGYKIKRADEHHRIVIGKVYNWLAHALFRLPIRDVDCDFRLIRRRALQQLDLVSSSGAIGVEMVFKLHAAGCVFAEAPVHHYPRMHGRSQFFKPRRVARMALDFLRLWVKFIALAHLTPGSSRCQRLAAEDETIAEETDTSLK
jgi:glycosyltransferase involved in cell wall biosynthesis